MTCHPLHDVAQYASDTTRHPLCPCAYLWNQSADSSFTDDLQSNLDIRYGFGSRQIVPIIERALKMGRNKLGTKNRAGYRDVPVIESTGYRDLTVHDIHYIHVHDYGINVQIHHSPIAYLVTARWIERWPPTSRLPDCGEPRPDDVPPRLPRAEEAGGRGQPSVPPLLYSFPDALTGPVLLPVVFFNQRSTVESR